VFVATGFARAYADSGALDITKHPNLKQNLMTTCTRGVHGGRHRSKSCLINLASTLCDRSPQRGHLGVVLGDSSAAAAATPVGTKCWETGRPCVFCALCFTVCFGRPTVLSAHSETQCTEYTRGEKPWFRPITTHSYSRTAVQLELLDLELSIVLQYGTGIRQ
jgi:hypothetical protein